MGGNRNAMSGGLVLLPYAGVAGVEPGDAPGVDVAWSYADLDAVRRWAWTRWPQYAPADVRTRHERVARARAAVDARPSVPAAVTIPRGTVDA